MKRGDKLYNISNGQLETVTFIEEGFADPSCTRTTYLVKDANGRKARCSTGHFATTPKEAWERHLLDTKAGLEAQLKHIAENVVRAQITLQNIAAAETQLMGYQSPIIALDRIEAIENINHPDDYFIYFRGGQIVWNVLNGPITFSYRGESVTLTDQASVLALKQKVQHHMNMLQD